MKIIEAYATKNKCYQVAEKIKVKGLMLHSIGVPQPSAKVMANQFNQYQPNGVSVCVHAFIGADGNVYQILPWEHRSWHCGDAANSTHIGVEMTEPATIKYTGGASWVETSDGKNTKKHVIATYNTAVELFAFLCKKYNLDPMKDGVIISHSEGYKRGIASNHGDVEHIWKKFGLTMDGFRKAVKNKMAENNAIETANKPTANVIELPTLRKGDTGNEVKTVQRILRQLKYTGADGKLLAVDGDFGIGTEAAVKRFQAKRGSTLCDGIVGLWTWEKLLRGI